MKLVTLESYQNGTDAHIARTKLESAGILALIKDEQVDNLMPFIVHGIQLQVREEDYIEASKIIGKPVTQLICPNCNSTNIKASPINIFRLILGFLIATPIGRKARYTCKKCNHSW